jgi:hypothetical protein
MQHAGAQQAEKSRFNWSSHLAQWLSNPLLVTVVAALLGSWLLPQITRQWQDHQKALEIQTGLVSDMSESVSRAVSTGRFLAAGLVARASADRTAEQRAWNDGYREWTTTSASIGAKLRAYSGPAVGNEWRSFTYVVTDFLQLSTSPRGADTEHRRQEQVLDIYRYRDLLNGADLKVPEWKLLAELPGKPGFQGAYAKLARGILGGQDELVQRVLDAHVSGF